MVGCLTSALPSRPPTPRPWLLFKPHPLLGSPTDAGSAHSAAMSSMYLPLVGDLFMSFLSRVGILCFSTQSLPALPRLIRFLTPSPPAVQVSVGARGEARGAWTRFPVAVLAVFRSGEERARRGSNALWVPTLDAACGCPRLLPGRRYLLLGGGPGAATGSTAGRGPGLSAARGSLVLPWRDAWTRRLRRMQRRERRGRCGTA